MSNQEYYKVVVHDLRILKILKNEPIVALKERNLIKTLKETMQSPPHGPCRNPSLRLVTKARACKGVRQEWSLGVTFHVPGRLRV
jgi:hypothetical protein